MDKYKRIKTQDGTQAFYSPLFDELTHSETGAKKETIHNYCKATQISRHSPHSILEVGFGSGLGFMTSLEINPHLYYAAFEIDPKMIEIAKDQYPYLKSLQKTDFGYELIDKNLKLKIYMGDARKTITQIDHKFHSIYQDAFSPKRNAYLWTKQWFSQLKNISHKDCILGTYSASSSIRKALIEAGWGIENYPGFGGKKSSTLAFLNKKTNDELIEKLGRSPVPTLTDEIAKDYTL